MKTTLKAIKNFYAKDITYIGFEGAKELIEKEGFFKDVAYSMGIYGCNGAVVQGAKTGEFYKVTSRTSVLFIIH